jgi:hypothetical protein
MSLFEELMRKSQGNKSAYTIHTKINGVYYGSRVMGTCWVKGQACIPSSIDYYCSQCGTIWAILYNDRPGTKHNIEFRRCSDCGGNGSLLKRFNDYQNESLALNAIIREIDLVLADPVGTRDSI